MTHGAGDKRGTRKLTQTKQSSADQASEAAGKDPLYGVAMLRIAMELKKAPDASPDDIVTKVLRTMNLSEPEFRAFLGMNGGLLRMISRKP